MEEEPLDVRAAVAAMNMDGQPAVVPGAVSSVNTEVQDPSAPLDMPPHSAAAGLRALPASSVNMDAPGRQLCQSAASSVNTGAGLLRELMIAHEGTASERASAVSSVNAGAQPSPSAALVHTDARESDDLFVDQPVIVCRHGVIHPTHSMLATVRFVFCGRCGCYASSALRSDSQLYQPCNMGPRTAHARLIRQGLLDGTEPTVPRLTFTGQRARPWRPAA